MTAYEIIMVVLTFLSLLIAVDAKNRKKQTESAFTSAGSVPRIKKEPRFLK